MASEKITAMPNLAGGQVPTDLIPAVDLSALPASQNVKTTLNDLFSTVTKNITDRALRFQAAGSTPALSTPTTGAIYFDGSKFQASQNGGAWTAVVLAGLITTSGLTQKADRILGRTTTGTGAIEEISIGSGLSLAAGSLAASGLLTASGYTQNTARLIGRSTAGVGAVEEISIGSNLSLVGGVLSATGGGGTPGGSVNDVQYHASGGTFGGSNNFQFKITGAPTVGILATSASHQVLTVRGDAAQTAEIVQIVQGGDNAASMLTLQEGVIGATPTSNFPLRYESAGGTLYLGLRARPATGTYQFVSPGVNTGSVVYELGTLGSNNGLGLATGSQSPSMFAGNIQCVWWSGSTGNTVFNEAYQTTWGSNPTTADIGLLRPVANTLRVTNGSTGGGRLQIGGATGTSSALAVGGVVAGVNVQAISASRTVTMAASGTYIASSTNMTITPVSTSTAVVVAGSNQVLSTGGIAVGFLYGLQNIANHQATSTATAVIGLKCFAYCLNGSTPTLAGADYTVEVNGTGTVTNGYGDKIYVNKATGTLTNAYGVSVDVRATTNAYGLFVDNISGASGASEFGVYVKGSWTNVSLTGSINWTITSDQRLKRDIVDYELGLSTLRQLRPRRFTWNEISAAPGRRDVGLIAQEVAGVTEELIITLPYNDELGATPFGIDTSDLTFMLVNAARELDDRITALEKRQ